MANSSRSVAALAVLALLSGCTTTAGPFVTNISGAGPGMLRIDKCEVEFTTWGYQHISTGECTSETVSIERVAPSTAPREK